MHATCEPPRGHVQGVGLETAMVRPVRPQVVATARLCSPPFHGKRGLRQIMEDCGVGSWFLSRKFSEVTQPQSLRTQSIGNQQWGDLSETCVGIRRLASGGGGGMRPRRVGIAIAAHGPVQLYTRRAAPSRPSQAATRCPKHARTRRCLSARTCYV